MNSSSKFVVATHIMTGLAARWTYYGSDYTERSDFLAMSANTNPVVIRRILGLLAKANLIVSKSGPNGGSKLNKLPSKINLGDVYKAVEQEEIIFHYHYKRPNDFCPIGGNIQDTLSSILKPLTNVVIDYLENISLEEVMKDTMRRSGVLKYLDMGYTPQQIEEMFMKAMNSGCSPEKLEQMILSGEISIDK